MTLVGRANELARIEEIAAAPVEGALLVVGEYGRGKSALLEAAQARSGVNAVVLHTNPTESGWPLSGFSSLFASIGDSRAVEFGGRFALRSTEPDDMFAAAQDLLSVLRGLDLERILVLIDDIDTMDQESQILIGLMAGRLGGCGICLVATASRLDLRSPLRGFPVMELGPLCLADCLELATTLGGDTSDDGTMRIVATQSAGSPLAVHESIHLLNPEQLSGREPLSLPLRVSPTAQARVVQGLDHLQDTRWRMLERLSLAPLAHTATLLGLGEDAPDVIDDLIYSDLVVVQGAYLHLKDPTLRSSLFWGLDSKSRRELHRELAEAMGETDPRLAVWHRSFTGLGAATGVELLGAAVWFAGQDCVPAAVEFGDRALAIGPVTADTVELLIDLVNALFLLGDLAQASRYLTQAGRGASSPSLVLKLATLTMRIDYFKVQRGPAHDVGAWVGMYSDADPGGAVLLLSVAAAMHLDRWEIEKARTLLVQTEPLLHAAEPGVAAYCAGVRTLADTLEGHPPPASELFDAAERHSSNWSPPMELILLGQSLGLVERYADARRMYAIIMNQHPAPAPIWVEATRFVLVDNEIRSGNFHLALLSIEEWEASSPPLEVRLSSRLLVRARHLYLADRIPEFRDALAECLGLASYERNQVVVAKTLALQGILALMDHRGDDAVVALELAGTASAGLHNPGVLRDSADRVEAYAMTGRLREAKTEAQSLQQRTVRHPSRWATLALARVRALVAPDDAAVGLFRAALDLFDATDSPYELGRTWSAFADALERLGRRGEVERARAAARSAFDVAGASAWSRTMSERIAASAGDLENPLLTLLSDEEREVVQKVRQGYRNREIADALYISLRTVELRLTHVYRKVGARSRSHLVALIT